MSNHHSRSAYTLIEILVATAVSMILMLAIMRMFGGIGESLNRARAEMNLALELRRIQNLLQYDLDNKSIGKVTTNLSDPDRNDGYFTYQEGPMWTPSENEPRLSSITTAPRTAVDLQTAISSLPSKDWCSLNMAATDAITPEPDSTVGDLDDQLAFTVHVPVGSEYRGRGIDPNDGLGIVESGEAEVAWFVRGTTLYRRVLLIDDQAKVKSSNAVTAGADLTDNRTGIPLNSDILDALWGFGKYEASAKPLTFYDIFDLSVRWDDDPLNPGTDILFTNQISDLADRQNRFGMYDTFPYPCDALPIFEAPHPPGAIPSLIPTLTDYWDVPLSPSTAPRRGEDIVMKNVLSFDVKAWIDNDFILTTPYFADLGWRGTAGIVPNCNDFSTKGRYPTMPCVYDTWWDDTIPANEPPYGTKTAASPALLRAIQITIRAYEPQFKTVQEIRVVKRLEN